jgi:glucose/arabinose dehydrogenase
MVAGGLKTAQGLTEDGAGNLYVTENAAGRVDLVLLTFKIVPQSSGSPAVLARNQPLCVQVARSSGFSRPVVLQGGQGYRVISQPNGDRPGEVLPEACTSEKCSIRITAQNGQLTDGAWFEYRSS